MKSRLHAYIGTTRQLEILLAVHDKKSINEAARSLFLSQPTVSIQMKKLAEAAGAPIYNVVNREFVFTDVGGDFPLETVFLQQRLFVRNGTHARLLM